MSESAEKFEITVSDEDAGKRLDALLAANMPEYSRVEVAELIDAGAVEIAGLAASKIKRSLKVVAAMQICVNKPAPISKKLEPNPDLQAEVLFEDESMIVFAKPPGMVVHPQKLDGRATLANLLVARYGDSLPLADEAGLMPGIVHRLDSGTSGVIVCARTQEALDELKRQFREREVEKHYVAIVECKTRKIRDSDEIDSPIERDPGRGQAMRINKEKGRPAVTRFTTRQKLDGYALLDVYPQTGRTHQIRVHLASRGWPVVADHLYSNASTLSLSEIMRVEEGEEPPVRGDRVLINRQALHAMSLKIKHPKTGAEMVFEAEMPDDMEALLMSLRIHRLQG